MLAHISAFSHHLINKIFILIAELEHMEYNCFNEIVFHVSQFLKFPVKILSRLCISKYISSIFHMQLLSNI